MSIDTSKYGTLVIGDLEAGGGNKIDLYYNSETGLITEVKTFSDKAVLVSQDRLDRCDGFNYGPAVEKLLEEMRLGKGEKDEVIITRKGILDLLKELAPKGCPECGGTTFSVIAETSGAVNLALGTYETDGFDIIQIDCMSCNHCLRE